MFINLRFTKYSIIFFINLIIFEFSSASSKDMYAVVTLVMGKDTNYNAGAIALGQSLIDVGSKLHRVCMVTEEVPNDIRISMQKFWQVLEVPTVYCNHKVDASINPEQYDLNGERYQAGIKRWSQTCTKFVAWNLTQYKRVIFMDSDTLVVGPIDDVLYGYTNSTFAAAPETFPPDTFNSGFMVLTPSKAGYDQLLRVNTEVGSAEGGDQGVFNNGLCPNWFLSKNNDKKCGKLPWIFNAAYYSSYLTLRKMQGLRLPAVIHFVSDGKPWKVLMFEYVPNGLSLIPEHTKSELKNQAQAHVLWRNAFFRATEHPPKNDVLIELVEGKESSLLSNKNVNVEGEEALEDSSIIKTMIDREGLSKKKEKMKLSKSKNSKISKNSKKQVEVEVPKKTKKSASERKPRKRSKKKKARE